MCEVNWAAESARVGQRQDDFVGPDDAELTPHELIGEISVDVARIEQIDLSRQCSLVGSDARCLDRDRAMLDPVRLPRENAVVAGDRMERSVDDDANAKRRKYRRASKRQRSGMAGHNSW